MVVSYKSTTFVLMNMENNLYYTPTIEEFHVGFEYERLWLHIEPPMWGKETFYLNDSHIKLMQYSLSDIEPLARVKTLDQSDIESLGWESDQYVPERNICLNFKKPNDWYLNYWFGQTPYIEISRDGYDTGCALNVKNKSELIKLMQQLNIK